MKLTETWMTRHEREDLQRLVRQREKALLSGAKQRSAELLADFENQIGQIYRPEHEAAWEDACQHAEAEITRAKAKVAAQCAKMGIPAQFAPSIEWYWQGRGYDNFLEERRKELRVMAKTRIDALEKKAITEINLASVEAQTEIARAGLTSKGAFAFLDKLPTIESLMPALSFEAVAGKAEPPVAEQLISPGALRQRRYRERHRDAAVTSHNAGETPAITKGKTQN